MAIFVGYPWLAAVVGLVLVALGRWMHRRLAVGVGIVWIFYAAYETAMQQRWLCSGECNIRVDLILIYPFLLVASAAAGFSLVRAHPAQRMQ